MEVYVSNDEQKKYIKDVRYNLDGNLSIVFADGRKFSNIKKCDENIEKINKVQEEQAEAGLDKYVTFKNKVRNALILMGCSGLGLGAVTGAALSTNVSPIVIGSALGVITIFGTIPSILKCAINKSKIIELDKIKYRNEHIDELKEFKEYENSLVGVSFDARAYLNANRDMENPFNMVNIDSYTKSDLETIISNIESERELGLVYVKSKKNNN